MSTGNKVLVAGASGLIGVAAIEGFLSEGWDVVGISRRKPVLPSGRDFEFVPVDLRNENASRDVLSALDGITHVAYAAIHENADDLVSGWSNADQIEINNAMLRNVIEPLVSGKSTLKHVSILQGTKAYGVHLHPIAVPARESDPRDNHANFFFDQQDYVRDSGEKHGFTYTVLRPQLVTGKTAGALNVLPAIGVYAAIRREKGEPFGFPGGPSFVWETADADLVGQVMVWAATSPQAANEIFNVTNGDVFEWRSVWPALAKTLGVNVGADDPVRIAQYIRDNADVWARIVDKYGLESADLRAFVGQGDQHADFAFASGALAGPVAFVSTVKLRKAGFNAAVDTQDAFSDALQSFIDRKLLPPAL
ncbi:SDR family oxidoreductase [Burkholderia aenigmatica]|uniref:SDR family oxidoreductase n=1 Tax=Burkholderia cepacia complex TaxID=87882 RepID=UPI00158DFD31|nr:MULTISPECIES: SDR family oxidoreductase [Burkholderia cepacia complex]UKD16780.1 SDR family oxidoreductase [Burkholderia aenigmatica]